MPPPCLLASCKTVHDGCSARLWLSARAEDYLIPSIHRPFVIDNATNGSRALVVPDLSSTFLPPPPFSLEDPETMAFTWVLGTPPVFFLSAV